jgi:hypothetical protein
MDRCKEIVYVHVIMDWYLIISTCPTAWHYACVRNCFTYKEIKIVLKKNYYTLVCREVN